MYKATDSLCWDCGRALGGCSWSKRFKPVKGWEAEKTVIQDVRGDCESYHVISCPRYRPDRRKTISMPEVLKALNINRHVYYQSSIKEIERRLKAKGLNIIYNYGVGTWEEIRR